MTTVRHLEDGDRERVAQMQRQAFLLPPERVAIAGQYPAEQGWVVEDEGVVHGALRIQKLGQFFGGRPVPCAAVSSVKVAAESRGGGYGGALLREVLEALREEGVAVSTLFPVHLGVYRRYGWETAFACQRRRLPLGEAVVRGVDSGSYRVEAWDDGHLDELASFYSEAASAQNGCFERTGEWWTERVLAPRYGREPYRYVARSADGIGGYLLYTQEPAGANLPYGFELDCRDFFWTDPSAAAALLDFVRAHAGMGHGFRWIGPVADPLEQLLSGLGPSLESRTVAMFRLVNVAAALEARGYPPGLRADFRLAVNDDVLQANHGTYAVTIAGGRASVTPDQGAPDATVDVRALAAMFTGWLDPVYAGEPGRVESANANVLETLRTAFGGAAPWMAEFF